MRRIIAWTILVLVPERVADRLCRSETFVKWLDPRGWLGIA